MKKFIWSVVITFIGLMVVSGLFLLSLFKSVQIKDMMDEAMYDLSAYHDELPSKFPTFFHYIWNIK